MVFTSFEFLLFFLGIVLLRHFFRSWSAEKWFLLCASFLFYLSWSIPCMLLIVLICLVDYSIGRRLEQTDHPVRRKAWLLFSLLVNLGLLGFFKYANFFLENLCFVLSWLGIPVAVPNWSILLPPAISYFTFASLSYVLDVYYERITPCRSLRDYSLFIAFFPKLLAGPIVRATEFLPQLTSRRRPSAEDIETGLAYFLLGGVKKLVISDQIAGSVNMIFSAPTQYDNLTLWQGLLGYTVQIYCDFSGYSDMAIGCARVLGYRIPENFQMPYSSTTITEFWRRWHITLSSWFRDYVFIPREIATRDFPYPVLRTAGNMMLTMLLCGLWHGASWNFVIWGGIHGAALAAHKAWSAWRPLTAFKKNAVFQRGWNLVSRIATLGVVLLGWVFFRTGSLHDALGFLRRLIWEGHDGLRLGSPYILPAITAVFLAHLFFSKERSWAKEVPFQPLLARSALYTSLLLLLVFLGLSGGAPFIYFQF